MRVCVCVCVCICACVCLCVFVCIYIYIKHNAEQIVGFPVIKTLLICVALVLDPRIAVSAVLEQPVHKTLAVCRSSNLTLLRSYLLLFYSFLAPFVGISLRSMTILMMIINIIIIVMKVMSVRLGVQQTIRTVLGQWGGGELGTEGKTWMNKKWH